jgi:small subunit ribosomal protein S16
LTGTSNIFYGTHLVVQAKTRAAGPAGPPPGQKTLVNSGPVATIPASHGQVERGFVAVRLRLKRFGRRNRSHYRITAVDARRPRDGRVLEELGWYDPCAKTADQQVSLKRERIEHWLSVGAQPSDTLRDLLARHGIVVKK